MNAETMASHGPRLHRLLGFLERDPQNATLLGDAAWAAFDDNDFAFCDELIARYRDLRDLPPAMANLAGMAALAQGRHAEAAALFEALHQQDQADPALRFNLAWTKALLGKYQDSLDLLDEATIAASHRGPALKIQMMHHLGQLDEALACGQDLAARHAGNQPLMAALATLAMDAERIDLARQYASRAGDSGEGLATQGMLVLGDENAPASLALFDKALGLEPRNARAWMGRGLSLLIGGDTARGSEAIDHAASLFGHHIGSWVAAGWAHYLNGSNDKARSSFHKALALDSNFSESHGGLAVLDLADGDPVSAGHHCEVALRLDKHSFGGALAKSLLLEQQNHPQAAARIRAAALTIPAGPGGRTLLQSLAGFRTPPRH